ncbi:hypothetical protein FB451DRAFT_1305503 [Mycena latifolia]|nr:hypothetical protein FB451DRAFT_1305503 [Mycena latifolia]
MTSSADVPTFPTSHSFEGHIRKDKAIFGVHCGDPQFLLNLPAPQDAPSPTWMGLDGQFDRISWVSLDTLALLFVPHDNPFHGPLFSRLRLPSTGLPLVTAKGGGWRLAQDVVDSWKELENGLRRVRTAMEKVSRHTGGSALFPYPLQYGYDMTLHTRHTANNVAMRARNAFLPLMGTVAMMFSILDHHFPPSWRDTVIEYSGVHPQWLAELQISAIGDMKNPRIGGIIDLTQTAGPEQLQKLDGLLAMILGKLPVPLYFHWGNISFKPKTIPAPLKDRNFYPDADEIAYLLNLPGKVAFSLWHRWTHGRMYSARTHAPYVPEPAVADINLSAKVDMPRFPQPEKNSGQRYGEDVHAFFARRNERNEQLARMETEKTRQERLQRQAYAAQGTAPGKKGARVYIWEEEDTGFFIRRAINRGLAADMWDEFTPNQRLYDGFHNQWDLCSALAPEEPQGSNDNIPEFPEFSGLPDALLPEQIAGNPFTSDDLERSYGLRLDDLELGEVLDDSEAVYKPYQDISLIPYARFGFTEPIAPASSRKPLDGKLSLKVLGDDQWSGLGIPQYRHLPLLFAHLDGAQSISEIPTELLDLRQEGADVSLQSNWPISVSQERLNDKLFYVLRSTKVDSPLYILLSSAATTIQVLRMEWAYPREIIFHLLAFGVEFRVCIRDDLGVEPPIPFRYDYTGLGYRCKGYQPTVVDHGVYVTLRERFLESPRGRAALFSGGIVGRLARLIVDEDLASLGPSNEVFMTGVRLWDGQSSTAYWDDTLTDQEIDLICGVYEIATDKIMIHRQCNFPGGRNLMRLACPG